MAAVNAIGPGGERVAMTAKTLESLREHGWRAASEDDGSGERAQALLDAGIEPALVRAAQILHDVGTDADKALAAYEAESNQETPDPDLLAALEQIVANANTNDPEDDR